MANIFISFAREDYEYANSLKHALTELGQISHSFDDVIAPGQKWQEAIFDQIRNVDALVCIVSPTSQRSSYVNHELGAALAYSEEKGKPIIIPIILGNAILEPPLSKYLGLRATPGDEEEIAIKISLALERQVGKVKAQEEEREEVQKKVETSAADFIQKSLSELQEREISYRHLAYLWYTIAYFTLVASAGFGVWRALVQSPRTQDWQALIELAVSGVIVIGLLVALTKYAFTLGKAFMVEALRNADRRHAISFGEFYLRAFGATAEWKDVKEAFQDWNIDKGSYFIGQNQSDFDPQIFALAAEITKNLASKGKDSEKKQ